MKVYRKRDSEERISHNTARLDCAAYSWFL